MIHATPASPPATPLRSHLSDHLDLAEVTDETIGARVVTLRAADTGGHRSSAQILVHRMYAGRGYKTSTDTPTPASNVVTLIACDQGETIGTISVSFDSPRGLLADDLFLAELNALRAQGRRLCEFTKLAMDHVVKSRRVLASLFHAAYIWAHLRLGFDDVVIEVNPRHVRYYQRMLGFTVIGPQRLNRRVDAVAVLMRLDFAHARRQIAQFAGRPEVGTERSLYPHFFSAKEEAGIAARLPSSPT
ncbi:long-chain N-acyl amino acid synthase [Piscinibacter sp. XHJ-5]|uniref:N-acyl amino acid synthase FeeM domain-containing protein n=1 Tax=Piscinibacter sp. XHJ-5 TaxID=3037797 RepID=UPI002452DB6E|nr:long-chain N-acyl amino acid synthase [Piscinibacter sp. XHJ-5]